MIEFNENSFHKKYYGELIEHYENEEAVDSAYKFGVASVVASLHDWCDELKKLDIKTVTPEEVKRSFLDWVSCDVEVNVLFNDLLKS